MKEQIKSSGETLDQAVWLARAGLTKEDLWNGRTEFQAEIGRQWKSYKTKVEELCEQTGRTPEQLAGLSTNLIPCWQPQTTNAPSPGFQIDYSQHAVLPAIRKARGLD